MDSLQEGNPPGVCRSHRVVSVGLTRLLRVQFRSLVACLFSLGDGRGGVARVICSVVADLDVVSPARCPTAGFGSVTSTGTGIKVSLWQFSLHRRSVIF